MCSDFHSADAVRIGESGERTQAVGRPLLVQLHGDLLRGGPIERPPAGVGGAVGGLRERRRDEQREGEEQEAAPRCRAAITFRVWHATPEVASGSAQKSQSDLRLPAR